MTDPESTAAGRAAGAMIDDMLRPFQQEATATRLAIENRNAQQRRINAWLIGFVAVTTVLVMLVLWMLVKDNQRRAQSRQILRNNAAVSQQIADCTTVGGGCYEKSQARLQATMQQLIDSNKAIASCARSTDTDAALDACVRAKLTTPAPTAAP